MHPSRSTLRRLIGALEEIGRREDGALACADGQAFLELETRAVPLVQRIVELAAPANVIDPTLRERGLALIATRHERLGRLQNLLSTTRDELSSLDQARVRARAMRPAYAPPSARARVSGFSAQG